MAERKPSSYTSWVEYYNVYKYKPGFECQFVEDCLFNQVSSVRSTLNSSDEKEKKRLANLTNSSLPVLHWAVVQNHYDIAALLLSAGADPNVEDKHGETAMDNVWEEWEEKSAEDLLKWIKLLEQFEGRAKKYKDRLQAFFIELQFVSDCSTNKLSFVQSALQSSDEDQKRRLTNLVDHVNNVPVLHAAVSRNQVDLAVELIEKGADPYVRDKNGHTAIDHMLNNLSEEMGPLIKLLNPTLFWTEVDKQSLETIKYIKDKLPVKLLDTLKPAPDGTTPLHMSLFTSNREIIHRVLSSVLESGQDRFDVAKILVTFDAPKHLGKMLQNKPDLTQDQWKQLSVIASKAKSNSIQEQFLDQMTFTHDSKSNTESSALVKASKTFPVFNEKSEAIFEIPQDGNLSFVSNVVELCNDRWPKHKKGDKEGQLLQELYIFEYMFDHKNEPLKCQSEHKQSANPWSCQAIFDLIFMATLLGKFLRTKSSLKSLKPMLYVIGSVVESTRIGAGSELDVTLSFDNLPGTCFELGPNAFNLQLSSFGLEHLKSNKLGRFIKNGNQFDYVKLLIELMKQVKRGLDILKQKLPSRLSFNFKYSPNNCKQCQPDTSIKNGFFPIKQCPSCRPSITYTKLGPCIIAKWKKNAVSKPRVLTMDFIMVFNHQSSSLELFRHMIITLFEETPLDWINTFRSYLERDRMLPEAMYREQRNPSKAKDPNGNNSQVAMKLLHYGDVDNCIIRPGQVLEIDQLQGNIRDLYLMTKIWKARFTDASFKSFMVKKILLDPALRDRAQADKAGTWMEIMNGPLKPFAKKNMSVEEFAENLKTFEEKCK